MKKILFLLLTLFSQAGLAELYKCSTAAGILYQDKPCQSSQTQKVIPQAPAVPHNTTLQKIVEQRAANFNPLPIERDAHGKIKRSEKAKDDFKAENPCPANGKRSGSCPGYVIDHITALACGGADSPENMQWQTLAEGKEKDGWERDGCKTSPAGQTNYPQNPPEQKENIPQTVYTGKQGGRYVLSKTGKKRYLGRKH